MDKCKCGGSFVLDGYDEISIDELDRIKIEGECHCNNCGQEAYYSKYYEVDFDKPLKTEIDTNVDGIEIED